MISLSKFFKRRKVFLFLDKRQRFAIQTVILTAGLLITQLIWEDYRFLMVGILSIASYFLTVWSLTEDISGIEWILLFILPVLFTASVSLFYFLLPARMFTRLVTTAIFAVGTYATLLAENIYNVAAARSIQLIRAAQSVGLLITLVVVFLSTSIVFSMRLFFWQNMLILMPIVFLLGLQSLWCIRLEPYFGRELFIYSFIVSLAVGELVVSLSFWPIKLSSISLLITASFYTLVGVVQQHLLERLFRDTIREYIIVFIFTLLVTFFATRWG